MELKGEEKKKKETGKEKQNPFLFYVGISLALDLLFLVPLINLIALPFSIFFGVKAIRNAIKNPYRYGGKWIAIISIIFAAIFVIFAAISFIFAAIVFFMYSEGMIKP